MLWPAHSRRARRGQVSELGPLLAQTNPDTVDTVARWIGGIGVGLAAASLLLTWYLWTRSGAAIRVTAFVRAETSTVHIEVASTGRLTATVRELEIRDHWAIKTSGVSPIPQPSRWSRPAGADLPVDIPPTGYLEADVSIAEIVDSARNAPQIEVRAWAQRGDGGWVKSKPVRVR